MRWRLGLVSALREQRWQRQRARQPRCPRGWSVGPPDFVGVGTYKSGTSWWYQLIATHPGVVSRGHPKELNYFLPGSGQITEAEAAAYAHWFPRPAGKLAGEWSPSYGYELTTPPKLAVSAPCAKLLMTLRDPVERYRSDVTMLRRLGKAGPEHEAASRGRYITQIENLQRFFPPDKMLILQYERCVADLRSELARTYRFLGLDDSLVPFRAARRMNMTREPKQPLSAERRQELVAELAPDFATLAQILPDFDFSLWPSLRPLP